MDLGLKHKAALVLGGGGGLGRAISKALADEGANVAFADIEPSAVAGTEETLASASCSAFSPGRRSTYCGEIQCWPPDTGAPPTYAERQAWSSSSR